MTFVHIMAQMSCKYDTLMKMLFDFKLLYME
jgi:hypothetical protein